MKSFDEENEMSAFEAASILMQMANSKTNEVIHFISPNPNPNPNPNPKPRKFTKSIASSYGIPKKPPLPPPRKKRNTTNNNKSVSVIADVPESSSSSARRTRNTNYNVGAIVDVPESSSSATRRRRNTNNNVGAVVDVPESSAAAARRRRNTNNSNNVGGDVVRKQKVKKEMQLTATPEMAAVTRERILEMGGYEIELVIEKKLHDTDLNKNHGRLSVPINKMRFDFATEEEKKYLSEKEGKNKKGIDVMIIDPLLRESVMCLKKWKIGSNLVYCLMTHWNSFVQQNSLRLGQIVQLWSFRMDGVDLANPTHKPHHICFAITKP